MQTVNTTYAIWDKSGTQVVAPTAMNTLFSGVPGASNNDGDPLILYDEQAQKWVVVEFSISSTPYYMLFAVSQSNDPTGAWWRWSFVMNGFPDYEKVGIWHDGYYMGTNLGTTTSSSDDVYVFQRNVMITGGASPQQVQFHNPDRPINSFHCIMPLDADGANAPASSPGQFITINDNAWGGNDELRIYECAVNWTTPSSSTFSMTQQLSVASFDSQFNAWGVGDIAQSGTLQEVAAQNYTLMTRGQYKNWGTNQSIVCTHTVDVDGTNHAGLRWYELEKTSQTDPTWSIRQESTYAPDANSRFMGSIAINDNHEIALGFNISSSSMSPNIRYIGQSASANASATSIMDIAESADMVSSPQSQTSSHRWGDYSLMTVDPVDNVTFWYTNEYYNSGKKTRIMSFTIGSSVLTAQFSGNPTTVNVGNTVTFTDASYGPNPITSWSWSFPGGTPSSYSGQNPPAVTYNTAGTYDVTLIVGDGSTTDGELKTNYINVVNCTVGSYPWSEGFENGGIIPDCWSNEYVTDVQNWAYQAGGNSGNPGSAHTGSYNAYLYNGSTTANVTKLVTPKLDMSSLSSATLTFWHTQAFWSPDQDELRVFYKTSVGGSWTLLATYTNDIVSWTQETINLPALSGDYYIAFEGTAQYGHGVCVDDVNVDGVLGGFAPIADFSANNTAPNVGQIVTFTDLSTNTPTSWAWSFNPTTVTYVGGTNSTSQNPQVTFDAAGSYSVTLIAANAFGSNGMTKTNYINAIMLVPGLWTGATSTDWGVATNWDDGNVPVAGTDVTVPTSPLSGNYPETNTGTGAECANLTIETGAHLFIPSNNTLTVNGTLTNNGGNTGLVVKSDASGTGSLINNTTGVNATVERYLIDGRWHFIGMPVSSETAGVFHLPSGHSDIYLRTHIEATNTWDAYIVPVNTPLALGRGYETWVGTPGGFSQPEIVDFSGALNTGDYTTGSGGFYGLEYTSGHGLNLIANPYPSALQGNIDTWTKSNVANSIWTWSKTYGNYVYWGSGNDYGGGLFGTMTGGVIPAMQGFFVEARRATPTPYVTIPQADRIHSGQAYYKETEIPANTLLLEVDANDFKDAIFVTFNEGATEDYDSYDVKKLFGLQEAPQLYSMIADKQLSINSFPELTGYRTVQLGFECGLPGNYSFTVSNIESFNGSVSVYLEDTKEGTMQDLVSNPVYPFTYDLSDEPTRFVLHFGDPNGIGEASDSNISVYSVDNMVYVQKPAELEGNVVIYNMMGQEIYNQKAGNEELISIPVNNGTGYYVVKVQSSDIMETQKVFIK
ncbi:MAG: PKD domain-containing protein [Chlorobi bacterium]|nr:PKD domain-containing protein [Chlorobiota bacterium]